ncbi:MAG: isopentenyl-diphosphate Delta-isomerase [Gemmatimonadaceae bacterium]
MPSHGMPRPRDSEIDVVLVDAAGRPTGTAPKLAAHEQALLHAAVSVFVFNARGELLLQRRAGGKYHSGGLWTNTACSHPRAGEDARAAAERALREEMGIRCTLEPAGVFTYRAAVGGGLVEHERDEVFVGRCDAVTAPDPAEVAEVRWIAPNAVDAELRAHPERFTAWFPLAWALVRSRGR